MKIECEKCVLPVQCEVCGKYFDLAKEIESREQGSELDLLYEKNKLARLVCWDCRQMHEED
ncbi:hypothetical protein D6817_03585 [Candidatus Pacearchaeota archaeon]|nr:MAG: hypothetical protein D6817_03585 [Candidatus Pacearchaeota archaeon]